MRRFEFAVTWTWTSRRASQSCSVNAVELTTYVWRPVWLRNDATQSGRAHAASRTAGPRDATKSLASPYPTPQAFESGSTSRLGGGAGANSFYRFQKSRRWPGFGLDGLTRDDVVFDQRMNVLHSFALIGHPRHDGANSPVEQHLVLAG